MSIFSHFQERFEATRQEEYSLQEYLDLCKQDKTAYASAAERLLMAARESNIRVMELEGADSQIALLRDLPDARWIENPALDAGVAAMLEHRQMLFRKSAPQAASP